VAITFPPPSSSPEDSQSEIDYECSACGWSGRIAPGLDIPECPQCHAVVVPKDAETAVSAQPTKNVHAAALGRLGGLKGGRARAERLTASERHEIASKAAKARWTKKKP
jgi:hypothetical protein